MGGDFRLRRLRAINIPTLAVYTNASAEKPLAINSVSKCTILGDNTTRDCMRLVL